MKFYPPKIIRFFFRYIILFIFVVFPIYFTFASIYDTSLTEPVDRPYFIALGCALTVVGCIIVNLVFLEKCFSVLILDEDRVKWLCPFRKPRVMFIESCMEIGAYRENANSGIPHEQIYFSDHHHPQQNMTKNGEIKASHHLIKFWYNEELCSYLIRYYPSKKTSSLGAYRRQRKK